MLITEVLDIYSLQVNNHSSLCKEHPSIIPAIARVLAESQKYMRGRNVSFISACLYSTYHSVFTRLLIVFLLNRMSVVLLVSEMWKEL